MVVSLRPNLSQTYLEIAPILFDNLLAEINRAIYTENVVTYFQNKNHASLVNDVKQSLMDIINAVCNTEVLPVPQKEQSLLNNDTTVVKRTGLHFNNHTSSAQEKQSPVPLSNDITVGEVNHAIIASQVKDTTTTIMTESDLNSSTANQQGKSHLGKHTNTTADMDQSHFTNNTITICCDQCGNQCSHQIINKLCSFNQSEAGSLNDATESMSVSTKLGKIRQNAQRLANIEAGSITGSTVSSKHSIQLSHVQEHSQNDEISGKLPQIAAQRSLVQNDIALETPIVKEKPSSYMSSPTFYISDSENDICDLASEISDTGDVSHVPLTEYEDNVDATGQGAINIRYGVTPDKQSTGKRTFKE